MIYYKFVPGFGQYNCINDKGPLSLRQHENTEIFLMKKFQANLLGKVQVYLSIELFLARYI